MKELISHSERSEPTDFEVFIKLPGDASIRMSSEGAASSHYAGFSASTDFLGRLQNLAIEELDRRRRDIMAELAQLGVEADE